MLKSKINATEFATLPDVLKAEYTLTGTDYLLQTDDAAALRNAKQRADEEAIAAKAAQTAAEKRASEAEAARVAAETEAAKKAGDIPALEASWQKKLDETKAASAAEVGKLKKGMETLLVDNVATTICAEVSTAPDLLMPHVKALLTAEFDGDTPITRVLGADGKPTAKTIDEFKADLVANEKFAAIIVGSKANGGAGSHKPAGGGAAGKKISELNEAERVALYNSVGQVEFDRRAAAERAGA